MSKLFTVLLLCLTFAVPALPLRAAEQPASVQPLVWKDSNNCTAWSINESKGLWATALHCSNAAGAQLLPMTILDQPATVVFVYWEDDLVVLQSGAHAPALKLSRRPPTARNDLTPGDEIIVKGFPLGIPQLTTTGGEFLRVFTDESGTWNLYDLTAGGGNSGSPVLNKDGVIGLLNFGWPGAGRLGGGTTWETLTYLKRMHFWE